ncbi:AAA family ATPase [Sphingomonas nostoxanthinifaciens]|uniref:AAA family ATPase n=1 Tax=Sphingomonas nostoxanthinifaciens TaxID=2872652 RepID=UPI001CC1D24D|nr:AAA family ATPase [Sphingomonas nostoxanthinifaciens]UAK26106.1 AAA family ATPase [Sphingomonas nostoxanthinifaciens]
MNNGFLLGRFMPPHTGHLLLVETARRLCDHLTILVCHAPDDPIPAELRIGWVRELFPFARVVDHATAMPQGGGGAWEDWRRIVAEVHPEPVHQLFGSEVYGSLLAAELGARFVVIDPERTAVPVSARAIRADPFAHWRHIPPPVRPHYARTICLHGPESTGKSTLAMQLSRHYDTLHVPEYGRTYCEQYGLTLSMRDLLAIARTHCAMAGAALQQCNRRLILDTDPLMTAAWADMLFERRDPWFDAFEEVADLYLLLDIDIPWVNDGTRFFGEEARRRHFFDLSRNELERRGLNYVVIGGSAQQRFARAIEAIAAAGL